MVWTMNETFIVLLIVYIVVNIIATLFILVELIEVFSVLKEKLKERTFTYAHLLLVLLFLPALSLVAGLKLIIKLLCSPILPKVKYIDPLVDRQKELDEMYDRIKRKEK